MKERRKDNRLTAFLMFTIFITIIALIVTSGTYAKYTSSGETVGSTATVAKWSIKVNGVDIAASNEKISNFNLFETIVDSVGDTTVENSSTDAEIIEAQNLIAPGTQGMAELQIVNESQVSAKLSIAVEETNDNNIPIVYSIDGTNYYSVSELTSAIQDVLDASPISYSGNPSATNTVTQNIYWRWEFEKENSASDTNTTVRDAVDTSLGKAANTSTVPEVTIAVKVIATQVN